MRVKSLRRMDAGPTGWGGGRVVAGGGEVAAALFQVSEAGGGE